MASVLRCDICGKVYGPYPEGSEKFAGISIRGSLPTAKNVYGEDEYDCCPECTEKLLFLINTMKTYPDRWTISILSESV